MPFMSLRFIVGIRGTHYLPDTTYSSLRVYLRELFYLPETDIDSGGNTEDDDGVDNVPLVDASPNICALFCANGRVGEPCQLFIAGTCREHTGKYHNRHNRDKKGGAVIQPVHRHQTVEQSIGTELILKYR